jgi:hypothetical protein
MARSSARMGDRAAVKRFLASLVDDPFPRILARSGEQHPHLDGLLLHRPLSPGRRNHRGTNFLGRTDYWTPSRYFSGFLHSLGKRQGDASDAEDGNSASFNSGSEGQVKSAEVIFRAIEPKILYFGTQVALISSLNEDASTNLAPMSSFWALG